MQSTLSALVDAKEARQHAKDAPPGIITEDDFAKMERMGLCDSRSLDLFLSWYVFGGVERGLSLTETMSMPKWLLKDFRYLLSEMGKLTAERREFENLKKETAQNAPQNTRKSRKISS